MAESTGPRGHVSEEKVTGVSILNHFEGQAAYESLREKIEQKMADSAVFKREIADRAAIIARSKIMEVLAKQQAVMCARMATAASPFPEAVETLKAETGVENFGEIFDEIVKDRVKKEVYDIWAPEKPRKIIKLAFPPEALKRALSAVEREAGEGKNGDGGDSNKRARLSEATEKSQQAPASPRGRTDDILGGEIQ